VDGSTVYDAVSGTEHAQFRQYDSTVGIWMSPDPYLGSYDLTNPQSLNRYIYALNNPLSLVDPFGLDPCFQASYDGIPCFTHSMGTGNPDPSGAGTGGTNTGLPLIFIGGKGGSKGLLHSLVRGVFSGLVNAANPQNLNSTIGVGVGGNAGIGFILGVTVSAGVQVVADSSGNLGVAINVGGNPGFVVFGAGAMIGGQASISKAKSIYDLRGGAVDFGASAGSGPAVGVDVAVGGGNVTGTVTVGPGLGTKSSALGSDYTFVPSALSTNCR
jgi:RHS repeat-associated protein